MPNFVKLHTPVTKLQHFKHLKIGKNLHNGGFSQSQSHNYTVIIQVIAGHQELTEGTLSDYCDGKKFKEHPLFSIDSDALQIILYYDELELCNVLGSCHKKHKIGKLTLK